jgi:LPXTG-motif cell wall-anchored protein
MKKNKTLLWVGIASALLIGGGLFWLFKTKKEAEELEKKKKEEEEKLKEQEQPVSIPQSTSIVSESPFKNKIEGDKFRKWMQSFAPSFRDSQGEKLDPSGSFNNRTIIEAYEMYKNEYASFLSGKPANQNNASTTSSTSSLKSGDTIYSKKVGNLGIYNIPSTRAYVGNTIIREKEKSNPIGTFISDSTEGFAKVKINIPYYIDFTSPTKAFGWNETPKEFYVFKSFITNKKP